MFFSFFFSSNFFILERRKIYQDHSESFDVHRTISLFLKFAPHFELWGGRFWIFLGIVLHEYCTHRLKIWTEYKVYLGTYFCLLEFKIF